MTEEKIYEKIHNEYNRKYWNLLSTIWGNKRGKELGITNQKYVLCVYFNKPSYDIGMLYERLIEFIKNSDKKLLIHGLNSGEKFVLLFLQKIWKDLPLYIIILLRN